MISSFSFIFYLPAHIYATYKGLFWKDMVRRPQQHQIQKVSFLKAATMIQASSTSKIYCIATFYLTELISRKKNDLARLKHTKNSSKCNRACNLYLITPFWRKKENKISRGNDHQKSRNKYWLRRVKHKVIWNWQKARFDAHQSAHLRKG